MGAPAVVARIAAEQGLPAYVVQDGAEVARVRGEGAGPFCLYCHTYECRHTRAVRTHQHAHPIGA